MPGTQGTIYPFDIFDLPRVLRKVSECRFQKPCGCRLHRICQFLLHLLIARIDDLRFLLLTKSWDRHFGGRRVHAWEGKLR